MENLTNSKQKVREGTVTLTEEEIEFLVNHFFRSPVRWGEISEHIKPILRKLEDAYKAIQRLKGTEPL